MTRQPHQLPNRDDPDDAGLELPPRLLADLRTADRRPAVPSAVDAAIRQHARDYFARQRRVRLWTRWAGAGAAAAALVLVAVRLSVFSGGPSGAGPLAVAPPTRPTTSVSGGTPAGSPFALQDINHDGLVDVLDALAVARGVKAGHPVEAWDVNGDGVVDQRDVDAIAVQAVRVTRQVSMAGDERGRPGPPAARTGGRERGGVQ